MNGLVDEVFKHIDTNMQSNVIILTKVAGTGRRFLKQCAKKQLLIGVKTHTFISLAKELCGKELYSNAGNKLLDDNQARDLVFKCVRYIPNENKNTFMKKKFFMDRYTAAMISEIIDELDANDVDDLTVVKSNAPEAIERMDAISKVRNAYSKAKKDMQAWDKNDLLDIASTKISESKPLDKAVIVLLDDGSLSKLENDFIGALNQKCEVKIVKVDLDNKQEKEIKNKLSKENFRKCRSLEVEERFIFRDILEKKRKAEDCTVVYLSSDYANGLLSTAELFDVDISLSGGVPFTQNKFYHLYKALKDWKYSDFSAEELYKLIYNKVLPLKEAWRFCRLLHTYNIGWGKERYTKILDFIQNKIVAEAKLLQKQGKKLDGKQKLALEVEEFIEPWKNAILTYIKVAEESGAVDEQKENLLKVLDGVNRQDPAAYSIIKKAIRSIEFVDSNETVLGLLLSQLESSNYLSSTQDKGKLLCLPLKQSLCTGRKYLYICGMSRFALQGGTVESPLLFDEEKKQLGLATQDKREEISKTLIKSLLTEEFDDICISYNCFDTEKMIDLEPAPIFRELGGLNPKLIDYNTQKDNLLLGDYVRKDRLKCVDDLDVLPSQNKETIEISDESREKYNQFTSKYDEYIKSKVYSPSSLETALKCPFKFYLQKVTGLYPYEAPEKNDDTWLTSAELGNLVHHVLDKYYDSLDGKVDAYDEALANKLIEEERIIFENDRPLASSVAMESDVEKARKLIRVAIEWTASNDEVVVKKVIDTEMAFGDGKGKNSVEVLINKENGEEFKLSIHGFIDRVDEWTCSDSNTTAILDYKTGSSKSYTGENAKNKIQPFIYALAVEHEKPELKVGQSGYLFLGEKNPLVSVAQDEKSRKIKGALIKDIVCNWLADKNKVLTKCAEFEITEDGHILEEEGNPVKHTEESYQACYCKNCAFRPFCEDFFNEHNLGKSDYYGK